MQTFLPYADFAKSAAALDNRRLGKQRVEALQVYRALTRPVYGWQNHPAVAMWRGWDEALVSYGVAVCDEWRRRGYRDTVRETLIAEFGGLPRTQAQLREAGRLPPWLGKTAFHKSHRRALVAKDETYRRLFGDLSIGDGYVWPVPRKTARKVRGRGAARPNAPTKQGKKAAGRPDV